jgi:hypothetical protein
MYVEFPFLTHNLLAVSVHITALKTCDVSYYLPTNDDISRVTKLAALQTCSWYYASSYFLST